jgi:formate-dependent nitrite reductase membrane component NrfD
VLSTSDLVKVFEITLAEIRSSQNVGFTVLALSAAAGSTMQRMHIANPANTHGDFAFWLWLIGVIISMIASGLMTYTKTHHGPLEDFIRAAAPGKADDVMPELTGALNRASASARVSHRLKRIILVGFLLVIAALIIEVYDSMPN